MKKLAYLIIIMVFLISGCSLKGLGGQKDYDVEKTLKVKNLDGSILNTYRGDDVDSISDAMEEDMWEMLEEDVHGLKEKYILSFNEKIDEKKYKKDVTVDYIIHEDMEYVKVLTYVLGPLGDTYYKIPKEVQEYLKKFIED